MRIKIKLKTNKLPQLYNHRIQSLIKEAIKLGNPSYKDNLYKETIPKPFCFSVSLPPKKQIKKELIKIDKQFTIEDTVFYFDDIYPILNISSSDYEFLINLHNGLLKLKKFDFSYDDTMLVNNEKIELLLESSIAINKPDIKSDEMVFKTLSPILIQDEKDKALLTTDENFLLHLNQLQNRIFLNKNIKGSLLSQPLELYPVKVQKQVVKHTISYFREKTGKPYMYLNCFTGIFKLKGNPKDLELLYNIGLGNRTSQGFGMLEVLG